MMNCKKAAELASIAMDRKLTFFERLRLQVHKILCGCCRCYCEQLDFLRCCADKLADENEPRHRLCDESRQKIKEKLRRCCEEEPASESTDEK
jgi:hypothetical protein